MEDRILKLAEKARGLPKAPGVYLMKDAAGVVLYVGQKRQPARPGQQLFPGGNQA